MEHLPEEPGLIVYYHCAVTIDYACFVARVYSEKGRLLQSVIHYLHHFIPGKIQSVPFGRTQFIQSDVNLSHRVGS